MHISRFVLLVSKPLLSSCCPRVAPVLWAPCRTITTGQDHVRFVSLVSKPLLSSCCPRVAPVLCRTITTGQDHVRLVSLVTKPLLSSCCPRVAPVLWAPCRTITTGQDHVRCGNVGGRQKKDLSRELDVFLGMWTTNVKRTEQYLDYITNRDRLDLKEIKPGEKSYYSFARSNGEWIVIHGIVGAGDSKNYIFKMGEPFEHKHKDEPPVHVLVIQDVKGMTWVFRQVDKQFEVQSLHMMVKKGTLFVNKVKLDGNISCTVFFKD